MKYNITSEMENYNYIKQWFKMYGINKNMKQTRFNNIENIGTKEEIEALIASKKYNL